MLLEFVLKHAPISQPLKVKLLAQREKIYFLLVGATAAGVHWLVASAYNLFIDSERIYVANVLGFVVALLVSVLGHTFLTFFAQFQQNLENYAGSKAWLVLQVMLKQALVGLGSFALNNALLYYLNQWLPFPFTITLLIVLVVVAVITFLVSKYLIHRPLN